MKTLLQLMFLLSLLSLASCSAKKVGTTLRVSNSMAITNSTYAGGLVFYGRSTTGKIFSIPVALGAGSGNQVQIELDRGQWAISAIGWSGGPVLEGTPSCATVTTNLDSMEQTINLDLDPTNCTNASFGGNNVGDDFKALRVITCGTFYQDITTPNAAFTDDDIYCANNDADLHAEMKVKAKSVRVFLPIMIPGAPVNNSSPLSECINLTDGRLAAPTKRLPAAGLPIHVELYDEQCAVTDKKLITGYVMPNGLDTTYASFDHKYFHSTQTKLYLLASISRRGTTPFLASMPKFICDGASPANPCIKVPYVSSSDRAVNGGQFFFLKDAGYGIDTCAQLSTASTVQLNSNNVSTWNAATDCELRGNKIFIKLPESDLTTYCTSTCSLDVAFSPTYSISIEKAADPDGLDAYNLIFRTVGYQDVLTYSLGTSELAGYLSLSVFHQHDERNDSERKFFGQLSRVREMLMPAALGGIFQGMTSTDLLSKSINLSFWDEGIQKSYRITSQPDSGLLPDYIHNNSDATATNNTTIAYTHKITISRILGGAYYPEQIIRIKFGSQIGMMESLNEKSDSTKNIKSTERDLLFWNTEDPENARFEYYEYNKDVKVTDANYLWSIRTKFTRAEREDNVSDKNARIDEYSFESRRDGVTTTFNERGTKSSVVLSGSNALYLNSNTNFTTTSANLLGYFSQDMLQRFRKSAAVTDSSAEARSPDGSKIIMAWAAYNGLTFDLQVVIKSNGSSAQFYKFNTGADYPFIPKVSINNNGEPLVAWVQQVSFTHYGYAMVYNGTDWIDTAGNPMSIAPSAFGGTDFFNYGSAFPIAVLDRNPTSSGSAKTVIYHNMASSLKQHTFSGSWGAGIAWGSSTAPLFLEAVVRGGVYYVYYVYQSSFYYLVLDSTTFASANQTNVGTSSGLTGITPSQLLRSDLTSSMDFYLNTSTGILKWNSPDSSPAISGSGNSVSNIDYETDKTPYCFARSTTASQQLAIASVAGCQVPNTSYANPIRSEFKFDIDSLKPDEFDNMFSL